MTPAPAIGDGLDALRAHADPRAIAALIGKLARWAAPETVATLPVWYPELARKQPLYKAGWVERSTNKGIPKIEGNTHANSAFSRALGQPKMARPNWSCCHIWGNDDTSFAAGQSEVNDPRYYSCPANMILLPTPLKAFTDYVPEVKAALRLTAHRLFGFLPEGREAPSADDAGEWLPEGWDAAQGIVVVPLSPAIGRSMATRVSRLKSDLAKRPGAFPYRQVVDVARYWSSKKPDSLVADLGSLLEGAEASPP